MAAEELRQLTRELFARGLSRRQFVQVTGALAATGATTALLAACGGGDNATATKATTGGTTPSAATGAATATKGTGAATSPTAAGSPAATTAGGTTPTALLPTYPPARVTFAGIVNRPRSTSRLSVSEVTT